MPKKKFGYGVSFQHVFLSILLKMGQFLLHASISYIDDIPK